MILTHQMNSAWILQEFFHDAQILEKLPSDDISLLYWLLITLFKNKAIFYEGFYSSSSLHLLLSSFFLF